MLFTLGILPSLIGSLIEGARNYRNRSNGAIEPTDNVQTAFRITDDIGLFVGGAVMMIAGLIAHLSS
jgi:hypothetical protein